LKYSRRRKVMNRIEYVVILASITLGMLACTAEDSEVPTDANSELVEPDSGVLPDTESDGGDECNRFCVWERYLEASVPLTFAECLCQPEIRDTYRLEQQLVDQCTQNETLSADFTLAEVEDGCIEAMSDDMIDALEEFTVCFTARLALIEPCLRSLQVGDLCSSCESYLTESGDPCFDGDLFDALGACTDNRPGF
jgi:hypothetical protein